MSFLIALALKHWKTAGIILAVIVLFIALAAYRAHLVHVGFQKALDQVEAQDAKAADAARKVRLSVDQCYDAGRVWDTISGQCQGGV